VIRFLMTALLMVQPMLGKELATLLRDEFRMLGAPEAQAFEVPSAGQECQSIQQIRFVAVSGKSLWVRVHCNGIRPRELYVATFYCDDSEAKKAADALSRTAARAKLTGPVLVRSGARVDLRIRVGNVVLHKPVRAVANGRMGESIRVKDEERRMLLGQVVGENRLEAEW
jgi:Chaperone for flagella basal body P-ring formation